MSVKDIDRKPAAGPNPMQLAARRAERFEDPIERQRFLDWFARARVATARGDDRIELWFAQAWNTDDSVTMAGLIEGASSVHHNTEQKRMTYR